MNRRAFLATTIALPMASPVWAVASGETFPVNLTEAEWRARLDATAYAVLREGQTERAYSSPLNAETRPGVYHCKGCDQALYDAATKYDSGTGWPSFFRTLEDAVGHRPDRGWFITRTEEYCTRCGGHLGHVFDDGPPPTGLRHCINGAALTFRPA